MEEDFKNFNENEDFYYNNRHIENDNEKSRENMNRFYNPNENYSMNKRENNNINKRLINENIRQILNDNLPNRNLNHIQEPNENNFGYQAQNPNYQQNISPPANLNPDYNQIRIPNFIPPYILSPIIVTVGIPLHEYLDSRISFQKGLGLPPNFINQIPIPNFLSQTQNLPNMDQDNLFPMKNNNKSNFVIRDNNEINRNNIRLDQLDKLDNCNDNIIYFPEYKSNFDFKNLYLPDIRNKILNIALNNNYSLTKEEERMLFDPNIVLSNDTIFINEYMFYSPLEFQYMLHIS